MLMPGCCGLRQSAWPSSASWWPGDLRRLDTTVQPEHNGGGRDGDQQCSLDHAATVQGPAGTPATPWSLGRHRGGSGRMADLCRQGRHLSVTIPAGWSAKPDPIRQLTYPDPILAVGSWPFPIDSDHSCAPVRALRAMPADGVLLWVLESRPTADTGLFDPRAFPRRPRSFDLRTMNQTNASCTDQPGYVIRFQDAGRNFGVEIVLGANAPPSHRTVVEQVLQSLRPA
jgi:hypothetical protein